MKQLRLLATTIAAATTILLFSCNSGGEKSKEPAPDSSQSKMAVTPPAQTPEVAATPKTVNVVVVRHKVANYAKWKMGYDGHDSTRRASGLSNYVIARAMGKDSNMVMVVMKAADMLKAKEFASSTDLKETMHKAGVLGAPIVNYEEVIWEDNSKIDQKNRLMISHKVKDYNAWKKEFDDHKQARMDMGLVDRVIAHASGDNNDVSVVFAVNDMAKAKAFVNSKDLKDRMEKAGVEGQPSFFFYSIVQMY